ncbi:MAG: hypothetical protein KTR29_11795 [Rhodothermaceae bacterium]|nr:hypothetical protein [Rhodothermaceae bacterium]
MMKTKLLYAGLFLFSILSGCTGDQITAGDSEVIVTVRGESAFGEWTRDFVGVQSQADEFISEAAGVVTAVAEKFDGSIEVDISIGEVTYETVSAVGIDAEVVPAAVLAAHDITALRFGFLPKGALSDLSAASTASGMKPCTCMGTECCCTSAIQGATCGNIEFNCEGCGHYDGEHCDGGTQCWLEGMGGDTKEN